MAGFVPKLYQAVELKLESPESSIIRIGSQRKKRGLEEQDTASRKRVATEASFHFRQREPRSFLWRVLDEHLLEIQCVDLITASKEDSFLTFHASFTSPILPKGVAFADAKTDAKTDALQAFVLTADNDLHVVTISRDSLVGKTASTQPTINTYSTGLWKHAHAFKLTAISELDLVVSLTDGGLLRLEREDARWRETLYSEGGGLLRGLMTFKRNQTVRYGDRNIDASTAISVVATEDGLIWTASLNHTLTAWNREGKVLVRRDLLGGTCDPDQKRSVMPAEQGELLQALPGREDSQCRLFVYSPKERCFKIYRTATSASALVRADSPMEQESPHLIDSLDGHRLQLPFDELLDTNLWRLADYHVTLDKHWRSRIWVKVQCGAASRIFTLTFNLFGQDNQLDSKLEHSWRHDWTEIILPSPQEVLSIAANDKNGSLYVASSGSVAAVCHSDELDLLLNNEVQDTEREQDNAQVLEAANSFYSSLPSSLKVSFAALATEYALDPDSPSAFFAAADLGRQVSDEAYQQLEQSLPEGIGGLSDDSITAVLELIGKAGRRSGSKNGSLTHFGSQFMTKLGQETLRRDKMVLLSLLALLTFINNDFDQENLQLHPDKLFDLVMLALKQNELRYWLATTACKQGTLFESLFIGDWDSHAPQDLDFMSKLTYWCRQWTFAPYEEHEFTSNVFATLIKNKQYDHAIDFERFLKAADAPWVSYLKGRLYLMSGRPDEAALRFSSEEKKLSKQKIVDSTGLLTAEELSHFGAGHVQYLIHIATLFEEQQLYAYTAEYAAEALTQINEKQVDRELEQIDKRRTGSNVNALDQVADARAEIKLLKLNVAWEEITTKLFNAQLLSGRFQRAFDALAKMKRPELKRSSLQRLIESMLSSGHADLLLLSSELDNELADEADQLLSQLARSKRTQQVLYAYRVKRGDFRGAAEVLWEQLDRLRQSQRHIRDPEEESLPQAYLTLINTLACCGEGEDWLLAEPVAGGKRKLVTLEQLRKEYVAELDRRSDLQHGRYPLIDHDEMDIL